MLIPPFKPKLPEIAERDQTPVVRSLLHIIGQQQEQIQRLEDEIRRLQGGPPRPQLKPNTLEPAGRSAAAAAGDPPRRRGPQRAKTAELKMDATERVPLADVPDGAKFKGYRRFVVQDLEIRPHNTCYLLEQWRFPTGEYVTAPAPAVGGGHYGPQLISYVLHQYYHAHVTQPLLLAQLHDWGIEISAGQLNHLLTEGHDAFHQEKAELKAAGLATSSYLQADDTGARHQGRNGYCTYIGNERFAWFASTDSKSRVNFLELLQAERCYAVNAEALVYMAERGLAGWHRERLAARPVVLTDPDAWAAHLRRNLIDSPRAVALATEGALIGGLAVQGFNLDIGLVSDDAGQFDLFVHGLCWVHAERPLSHLVPPNESDRRAIAWVRQQVWFAVSGPEGLPPTPQPGGQRPDHCGLRSAVRHGNDLRTAQSGPAGAPAQPGRTAAGAGAPRLADPQQPQRDRPAGHREETQHQRRDPQRGRAPMPRHLRQPQEDLPQTGSLLLGVPQGSGGRPERNPVPRGVDSPARYGLNRLRLQLLSS